MKVRKPREKVPPASGWTSQLGRAGRRRLQASLLAWYRPRARPLRIRSTSDPWAILVAEVMAQQTQISRVDEAWVGFMKRYPGSAELATASTADVLRDWAGLGYNRRALALQRTAQLIETRHDGRVPDDIEALEALPGVGPYTARAVAAVAFGQAVAPVDTNIRRVVSRLVGVPMSVAELQATADWLVASDDPATWTHASMDLGATVCRSRRPRCDQCPISRSCESAGSVQPSPRMNGEAVPFELTTRWLRGRIVERLRDAEADDWVALPDSIGSHDHEHVAAAVASLERDGLLERRHDGSVRLPSSQT